jgi:hypothetical protein
MNNIGPRRTAPPASQPEGFIAPYDAFEPRFRELNDLVLVIFGIEIRSGDASTVRLRLLRELGRADGPEILEHGSVKSGFGSNCLTWFAYWKTQGAYAAWQANSAIDELFEDKHYLTGDIGIWREYCHISLDHNETSYSRKNDVTGIANLSDAMEITPTHGYWGSLRDRMVATAQHELQGESEHRELAAEVTLGKRIRIQAKKNSCLIKTTQDLSQISEEQLAIYTDRVEPALHSGIKFIRENAAETGCIGMRFIQELNASGEIGNRTIGVGYFASLGHLEKWTHTHPTHIEIMTQFGHMVEQFQGQPGLNLWHEVTVFPLGWLTGDYVNCSPDGTLLQST